jgi:hypothetical protein
MSKDSQDKWIELLSVLLTLVLYWIAMVPEWKQEMYLQWAKQQLARYRGSPESDQRLSPDQESLLTQFRLEISRWEHEQKP